MEVAAAPCRRQPIHDVSMAVMNSAREQQILPHVAHTASPPPAAASTPTTMACPTFMPHWNLSGRIVGDVMKDMT